MALRKFTEESPITYCIGSPSSPLIKIGAYKETTAYTSSNDKWRALKNRKKSDKFIIAWSGKWKTDVFEVTDADIKKALASNEL